MKKLEKQITISLNKEHYELIEKIAIKNEVSKAKVIRDAIKSFLDKPLFPSL